MVNVYSKCAMSDKRRLWGELVMSKRGFVGSIWCLLGDSNVVISCQERRGVGGLAIYSDDVECQEFMGFL